jgi:galactose-1-phosphate uridylyltransferase
MTKAEREMVIAHVLGRLAPTQRVSPGFITSAAGIGPHLDDTQLTKYIDGLVRIVAYDAFPGRQKAAMRALEDEYLNHTTPEQDEQIRPRLDVWVKMLTDRDRAEAKERVSRARAIFGNHDDDIPF